MNSIFIRYCTGIGFFLFRPGTFRKLVCIDNRLQNCQGAKQLILDYPKGFLTSHVQ